jgi:small subunit ribosomal protein S16
MLTIRLRRVGTTKRPCYRVVVIDARAPRDGRCLESLGYYHPRAEPEVLHVDYERVSYWASKGARLSDTVRTLIARNPAPPPGAEAAAPVGKTAATPVASANLPGETSGDETQVAT